MSKQKDNQVPHKMVFEMRFTQGYLYWDRAGRAAHDLARKFDSLRVTRIDGDRATLVNDRGLTVGFGHEKLDVAIQQTQSNEYDIGDARQFATEAEDASQAIVAALGIGTISRIGFRRWLVMPCGNYPDSQAAIKANSRVASPWQDFDDFYDPSIRGILRRKMLNVRVAISAFEQAVTLPPQILEQAKTDTKRLSSGLKTAMLAKARAKQMVQRVPKFGILVDLDAFLDFPPYPEELSVSQFLNDAETEFTEITEKVTK